MFNFYERRQFSVPCHRRPHTRELLVQVVMLALNPLKTPLNLTQLALVALLTWSASPSSCSVVLSLDVLWCVVIY
jgi:hypothetical protein